VPKAYVKVYGRLDKGGIRFVKDGYTDLRGRFDYVGINESTANTSDPHIPRALVTDLTANPGSTGMDHPALAPGEALRIRRLAVLVLSEAHGAVVREVEAPAR
jgi:hypothetical protein